MKRLLFLLMAMPLSVVVSAAPPNTLSGEVLACRDIVPDAARLTCFDRMAATVAPARVSSAPPSSAPRSSTPALPAVKDALNPQRTFGLSRAAIDARETSAAGVRVKELSHITARVARILHAPDRGAIFDLDNGQVWKQLDPDGTDVDAKAGDSIEISRGVLGSYWLTTLSHQRFNVARVR
ncbi:MAG TPA: hypothetical protein VHV80_06195 [Steroidobacteraceae bacterium]|jgi:hypothetical protein|nr:hypothetical protein [Steroidobacteraceae bacterium]